ncbi:coiled-coil domain-containing protein 78 isoform X2 [Passer montanus]|uniref:coiled-coil domain-containing protein 78 isoform X2 n=1 Tax=Passer montanus TaxID=9160 RepID=UPI001961C41F|nr:coiled-coil domain-containing protein 78 isoform X2 [Passer montanus]
MAAAKAGWDLSRLCRAPPAAGWAGAGGEEGPAAALCLQGQLEDRSQEMHQPGDPREEMGKLPGSRTDFPARMVLSEEEKLKISKDLVDLQIETNKMKERYETENFQLKTMMRALQRRLQQLEQGQGSAGLSEERDSLRERLRRLESSRQELGEEFIILKSNYLALGRELDKEVMRNEELTQELLSLAKKSSLPPGLAHQSSPGLGRGRAAGQPRSAQRGKLLGNQDHIKVELEKLKKTYAEQQQKLEERVLALGKELQEEKGATGPGGQGQAERAAVLLTSQGQLQEVEAENSRLQLQLKELNEEYRCRLAQHARDLANYMDSKPSSVTGHSKAPAGHAAMKNFVDRMLRDIRASYKCREEQLARAARGYRKRMKDLAKKHENLLIAYGLQREQMRSLGCSAMDCGPAELHLSIPEPELLPGSSRELARLREQKAKLEMQLQKSLKGASAFPAPPEQQLDEEGWAELRRRLREFTLNTQEHLEQQRSQLLARAVGAEEQVLELQGYIDQHLARYKQEILRLRNAGGSEVPAVPRASHEPAQPQPWEE